MTNYGDFYYCEVCGQIVSVAVTGTESLICDGQKLVKLEAKTEDSGKEKHVPVIEPQVEVTNIKIGGVPHPMTEEHHIEFIEVVKTDGTRCRVHLDPTGEPEASFNIAADEIEAVYEFCNVHGLWKA